MATIIMLFGLLSTVSAARTGLPDDLTVEEDFDLLQQDLEMYRDDKLADMERACTTASFDEYKAAMTENTWDKVKGALFEEQCLKQIYEAVAKDVHKFFYVAGLVTCTKSEFKDSTEGVCKRGLGGCCNDMTCAIQKVLKDKTNTTLRACPMGKVRDPYQVVFHGMPNENGAPEGHVFGIWYVDAQNLVPNENDLILDATWRQFLDVASASDDLKEDKAYYRYPVILSTRKGFKEAVTKLGGALAKRKYSRKSIYSKPESAEDVYEEEANPWIVGHHVYTESVVGHHMCIDIAGLNEGGGG